MRTVVLSLVLLACASESSEPSSESSEDTAGAEHTVEHHHHHGQGHHHDFSDVERFSAIFDAPDRHEWQKPDELVALMELRPGAVVADLGAGTGYFLSHLSEAVGTHGRVIALDVEPAMVEHMQQRIAREGLDNVEARTIGTDAPGLADASVDAILIVDTWHHIAEREAYAAKLRAALKPGGTVWVVDFTLDAPQGPPAEMRIAPEQTVTELQAGGLVAELVDEPLPYQYVVRARREEAAR